MTSKFKRSFPQNGRRRSLNRKETENLAFPGDSRQATIERTWQTEY